MLRNSFPRPWQKYTTWISARDVRLASKLVRITASGVRYALFRARNPHARVPPFSMRSGADIALGTKAQLELGQFVRFMQDFTGRFEGNVSIGSNVFFNRGCYISVRDSLVIGDNCLFGEYVSIHDNDHAPYIRGGRFDTNAYKSAPVIIGENVWVGAKVTILKGVTIGDNTVVGANAVVTRSLPSNCLAVGIPARAVKNNWNHGVGLE